jgi:predicted phosphodiesterase
MLLKISLLTLVSSVPISVHYGVVYAAILHVSDFNFVAAGDYGCDKKAHQTATNMQNKSPELVLVLGDLSYQKSADCWFQMMSPLINKTKMVFGDHEYNFKNSSSLDEYLLRFNLIKQYYSFDYGNVHFLAMSSEVPFDKDSKQYEFVNDDLKSTSENSSVNWIVVFIYEMLYTSPTFHKPTDTIRDIYHPIFDKFHVSLVLQAHSHNYQRTYPIKYNDKDASNPPSNN